MHRVRNWDLRLEQWATEVTGEPFRWGVTDCASLVRQALNTIYYTPPICPSCIPDYDDESSALRALSETGGVEDVLIEAGAEKHPVTFAQSGDVVVDEGEDGWPRAGVVVSGKSVAAEVGDVVERRDLPYDSDLHVLRL